MILGPFYSPGRSSILGDIPLMNLKILAIPNAMIRKSNAPDISLPSKESLSPERKPTLDTLHRPLKVFRRRHQQMEMILHHDKFMDRKSRRTIFIKRLDEQIRPIQTAEEAPPLNRVRSHEVGLPIVRSDLAGWPQTFPQGLKPKSYLAPHGADEPAPFQSTQATSSTHPSSCENRGTNNANRAVRGLPRDGTAR